MADIPTSVEELEPPVLGRGSDAIDSAERWLAGRPALLGLFADHVYGRTPELVWQSSARVRDREMILNGGAERIAIDLTIQGDVASTVVHVLLYLPAEGHRPATGVPVFVGLNFKGNAEAEAGGEFTPAWPVEQITAAGFGVATAHAADWEPDRPDGAPDGIRALWESTAGTQGPEDWGTLGVWAWGLSRIREAVGEQPGVDPAAMIVIGHSRMGKAALWAGAQDDQFPMVVSNNSGCGGASPSRRTVGETVGVITDAFPHWFCHRFAEFGRREGELPVDQHQLLALIAPRAVYVASAEEDLWADPDGERLSTLAAEPAFALFGGSAPAVGYHIRPGGHAILPEDWAHYLSFARDHLETANN